MAEATNPRYVNDLTWIAAAGAVLNLRRGLHFNHGAGTLFVDPYWVRFYLDSFSDGFRRRALAGTLCQFFFPQGVSVKFLNVLGMLVLAGCFVLLFRSLAKLAAENRNARTSLMIFALAASAFTACFYETMGDLLHVDLLLFCGLNLFAARKLRSETARLLLAVVVTVLAFFIHEASIFFFAPALPFVLKLRPRVRDFVVPALLYAGLIGLSMHWSASVGHSSYSAKLYPWGRQFAWSEATPTFRAELHGNYVYYFGPAAPKMRFWGEVINTLTLLIGYLGALSVVLPRRFFQHFVLVFGCVAVASVPLWIVAVDWGRFLTYGVFVAVMTTYTWVSALGVSETAAPSLVQRLANRLEQLARNQLVQLGVAFALITSAEFPAVHVGSMSDVDAQSFLLVVAVAIAAWVMRKTPAAETV